MRRRQIVFRTLPNRQAVHESFFRSIAGKYGVMQRHANRLSLTHRLMAVPNRRQPGPAPVPVHVQVALPARTPDKVREVIREVPVYRERPAPTVQPAEQRDRKQPEVRERIVERKETVERERIVEKQVVIVREVERIIREHQLLREQAITPASQSGTANQNERRISDEQPATMQLKPKIGTDHDRTHAGVSDETIDENIRESGKQGAAQAQAASIIARRSQPVQLILRNQTWPLAVSRKTGWRTDRADDAGSSKDKKARPSGSQRKPLIHKRQLTEEKHAAGRDPRKRIMQMSQVPVNLLYRQTPRKRGPADRAAWRAVPVGRLIDAQQPAEQDASDNITDAGQSRESQMYTGQAPVSQSPETGMSAHQAPATQSSEIRMSAAQTSETQTSATDAPVPQSDETEMSAAQTSLPQPAAPETPASQMLAAPSSATRGLPGLKVRAVVASRDRLRQLFPLSLQHRLTKATDIGQHDTNAPMPAQRGSRKRTSPAILPPSTAMPRTARFGALQHRLMKREGTPGRASFLQGDALLNRTVSVHMQRPATLGTGGRPAQHPSLEVNRRHSSSQGTIGKSSHRASTDQGGQLVHDASNVHDGQAAYDASAFRDAATILDGPASHDAEGIRSGKTDEPGQADGVSGEALPVIRLRRSGKPGRWASLTPVHARQRPPLAVRRTPVRIQGTAGDYREHPALLRATAGNRSPVDSHAKQRSDRASFVHRERTDRTTNVERAARASISPAQRTQQTETTFAGPDSRAFRAAAPAALRIGGEAGGRRVDSVQRLPLQDARSLGAAYTESGRQPHYGPVLHEQDMLSRQPLVPLLMRLPGRSEPAGAALSTARTAAAPIRRAASPIEAPAWRVLRAAPDAASASAALQRSALRRLASTSPWSPQLSQSAAAGADAGFEPLVPLAYAQADSPPMAPTAQLAPPMPAAPAVGQAAYDFAPMELRKQPAPQPAASHQPDIAAQQTARPSIDPEQLQQAIGKMNMLNPDQIAEQVYRALTKRFRFEQRLHGY